MVLAKVPVGLRNEHSAVFVANPSCDCLEVDSHFNGIADEIVTERVVRKGGDLG